MKITLLISILLIPFISQAQWGKRYKKDLPVNITIYEKPDFLTTPNGADDDQLECECYALERGKLKLDRKGQANSKIISCKTWTVKGKKQLPRADYTNLEGGNWLVIEYHPSGRIHRTGLRMQNGGYMSHSDTATSSRDQSKFEVFEYYQTCRSGTWMEYIDKDGAEAVSKNYKCP